MEEQGVGSSRHNICKKARIIIYPYSHSPNTSLIYVEDAAYTVQLPPDDVFESSQDQPPQTLRSPVFQFVYDDEVLIQSLERVNLEHDLEEDDEDIPEAKRQNIGTNDAAGTVHAEKENQLIFSEGKGKEEEGKAN